MCERPNARLAFRLVRAVVISTQMRRTAVNCCACTANGHAVAKAAIPSMKARRRIPFPQGPNCTTRFCNYSRDLRPVKWGSGPVCTAPIPNARCPLWVKSGHSAAQSRWPLYPESGHQNLACVTCNSSGSLAILTAIRRASSLLRLGGRASAGISTNTRTAVWPGVCLSIALVGRANSALPIVDFIFADH